MQAGTLNKIVEIYQPSINTDEYGNQNTSYVLKYTTRAAVSHNSGSRTTTNNEVVYSYDKEFRMRRYVPIEDYDRIFYDGKYWRVLGIEHDNERQQIIVQTELCNE